jgi:hypothetical protein
VIALAIFGGYLLGVGTCIAWAVLKSAQILPPRFNTDEMDRRAFAPHR